jgi:hypothetical protein
MGQLEKHIPAAAKAAIGLGIYGAAEAAPFQNRFKLTHYPKPPICPVQPSLCYLQSSFSNWVRIHFEAWLHRLKVPNRP